MSAGGEVKDQLHVYHNPFAGHTAQPKIPDGKATHSLGFSTQAVEEIRNRSGENVIHMLLYPGMNSALVVSNVAESDFDRTYYVPQFLRSNAVRWQESISGGTNNVTMDDGYAKWRVVSCGLQLKLLNSVEEDDGWWESCRVNESVNPTDWLLTTTANGNLASVPTNGTLAPAGLMNALATRQIANDPTYMTGLLRDLNRLQFECHPVTDNHDFTVMKDRMQLPTPDISYNASRNDMTFNAGTPRVYNIIENFIDFSHDMVYVRLHCRPNNETTSLGSRFHLNLVSNQEIIYDTDDRLSRYQTRAHNIGESNMSAHADLRRGMGGSANMVL